MLPRLVRLPAFALLLVSALPAASTAPLAVRGLHLSAPRSEDIPLAVKFISGALPGEGVNVLVLEFNYRYRFTTHPEVAEPDALSKEDVRKLLAACRQAGIRLIPQINMLGHQSWAKATFALLRAHPELDETPGKYPANEGIYCRSYCPLHPDVHKIVFDLMDELAAVCEADAFHIGMDEVFLLGEDDCPRCKGRNKAALFAGEVRALHDHLAASRRSMWMWGDRFLDGEKTGMGKWDASMNATADAVRQVSKDIVICDWHYDSAPPTAPWFALEGFPVVSSPWRKASVALAQLDLIRGVRANTNQTMASRMLGVLQTTWGDMGAFMKAYYGEPIDNPRLQESVNCFRELFKAIRN